MIDAKDIAEVFGPRCAEFNPRCGSCLMWRAHDEYAALGAAARKVTCRTCHGTGGIWGVFDAVEPCPDCADLRALLEG